MCSYNNVSVIVCTILFTSNLCNRSCVVCDNNNINMLWSRWVNLQLQWVVVKKPLWKVIAKCFVKPS